MFLKLLLASLCFVAHSVFSTSSGRFGLHRRRSSSECTEFYLGEGFPENKVDSLENKIECKKVGLEQRRDRLKYQISLLVKEQQSVAQHLEDLRTEMTGFASPAMRLLNYCVSGARPEEMIQIFEDHQSICAAKLKSLKAALFHVELYLLRQKKIA